ncbi:MAG: DMT family transporter [Actinomycetota bacterium]
MNAKGERIALASLIASGVLAGGNAVCIRFSNRELAPYWGASLRFILAALLSVVVVLALRIKLPRGRALIGAALYGLFQFGGSFGLAYYALVRIQAGLGQTLLALVPLATLLVAVAQRQERLRARAAVGAVVALGGVAVMSRASVGGSLPPLSLLAILGSVLCFAEAAVLVRRLPPVQPFAMNTVGMTSAAVFLLTIAAVKGEPFALPRRAETRVAIAYIVVIGSVVVFALALVVLRHWEASRYAYLFVLTPPITIVLSAWLDDERIGWGLLFGGVLILAGVYVGALRPARS